LRLGADEDHAVATVVLGLVGAGTIDPNLAADVHVTGPRAGQPLKADHVGDNRGQMGKRGRDGFVVDGRNRGRFTRARATFSQTGDGLQGVKYGGWGSVPRTLPSGTCA